MKTPLTLFLILFISLGFGQSKLVWHDNLEEAVKISKNDIKAQNMKLQSQFSIRGYPTVWFVSPDKDSQGSLQWRKLGRTGYVAGGPGAWISNANTLLGAK